MPKLYKLITPLLTLALTHCATPTHKPHTEKPATKTVYIQMPAPNQIRFSGKGAGAGMMLSASMGPMGIAIGVAIDEGIAKDIQTEFDATGHTIEQLINIRIKNQWRADAIYLSPENSTEQNETRSTMSVKLNIERYGFKIVPGENDQTQAFITGNIDCVELIEEESPNKKATPITLKTAEMQTAPLELLKNDGNTTAELLGEAIKNALNNVDLGKCGK